MRTLDDLRERLDTLEMEIKAENHITDGLLDVCKGLVALATQQQDSIRDLWNAVHQMEYCKPDNSRTYERPSAPRSRT